VQKIKIIFCTYPSIYSDLVLERLLSASHIQVVAIIESTRILRKQGYAFIDNVKLLKKVGLYYAFYLFLITIGYSLISIFSKRKKFIKNKLLSEKIDILKTRNINKLESTIRTYKADYLLSAHFNQLIDKNILDIPKCGCLNIHPGLLPVYKGVDPAFYMLLRNEKQLGVTLHYQDESFDTGSIIKKIVYQRNVETSLFLVNCKLFILGIESLLKLLRMNDLLATIKTENDNTSYDSWPSTYDVGNLLKQHSLINVKNLLQTIK
jgi:methionyl-tRNA formyltransferase